MIELSGVCVLGDGPRGHRILDGVDLRIQAGEVALISGPSGSGKSMLLRLLRGELSPSAGTVRVFDRDIGKLRRSSQALLRRRVSLVPQELMLLESQSALDNVAVTLEVVGASRAERRARSAEILSALGLACEVDVPARALSTGERRLVAIARAVVGDPAVVLADSPTDDLDSGGIDRVCSLIEELRQRGTTVVLASNDPQIHEIAASCEWSHYELRAGDLALLITLAREAAGVIEADPEASPNIVPFPITARFGGSE